MKPALIFDMDGVIVDSNPFHKQAWEIFCQKHGHHLSEEELRQQVYGKTNHDALPFLFGNLTEEQIKTYGEHKEVIFRKLFLPHITPVTGLREFLPIAQQHFEKLAIATSASTPNVDFTLDHLNIRNYFSVIVDETFVKRGKPDPEIYLSAASKLGMPPESCIVIEDSLSGIESAKRAGMKVIGITTTHNAEELQPLVDWVIRDFNELAQKLPELLDAQQPHSLA